MTSVRAYSKSESLRMDAARAGPEPDRDRSGARVLDLQCSASCGALTMSTSRKSSLERSSRRLSSSAAPSPPSPSSTWPTSSSRREAPSRRPAEPPEGMFRIIDKDGDGRATRDELAALLRKHPSSNFQVPRTTVKNLEPVHSQRRTDSHQASRIVVGPVALRLLLVAIALRQRHRDDRPAYHDVLASGASQRRRFGASFGTASASDAVRARRLVPS